MLTSSAKAKGRRLQQSIAKLILESFPNLSSRDVQSRAMGSQGTDIVLSEAAHVCFPYSIEAKNQEKNKGLIDMYNQAVSNTETGSTPLLIISSNNNPTLAIMNIHDLLVLRKQLCPS